MKADLYQGINGGGALMEHFLEEIAPLKKWNTYASQIKRVPTIHIIKIFSSELLKTKALTLHFLEGNAPLRHLLHLCLDSDLI